MKNKRTARGWKCLTGGCEAWDGCLARTLMEEGSMGCWRRQVRMIVMMGGLGLAAGCWWGNGNDKASTYGPRDPKDVGAEVCGGRGEPCCGGRERKRNPCNAFLKCNEGLDVCEW